ncbi:hypothetical protein GKC68_07010 [Pantoea sp. RSPAM1]|uniref:RloB domain-containing protein n=1 Tax=Pantoea sp. RSPAM1 TaxID=2675223 RepID=UPI00315D897C
MNLYILVEGRQTEKKVYPQWLKHLTPSIKKVDYLSEISENSYFLLSGQGYPHMLDVKLNDSLKDIRDSKKIDYFWIILDSDGCDMDLREKDIHERIEKSEIDIGDCEVKVIFQNPCIETWGLGHKDMISLNQLHGELGNHFRFYNVKDNDPEKMSKPISFLGSVAAYHESYLKEMLLQKNIRYTKKNPNGLIEGSFLSKLIDRSNEEDKHLGSFAIFYRIATELESRL